MNETGKQFFFTRATSSISGRAKRKFISVSVTPKLRANEQDVPIGSARWSVVAMVALVSTSLVGCSAFLPAHTHSNKRNDKPVTITMVVWEDATNSPFREDYRNVFHRDIPQPVPAPIETRALPALAGAAAAALVGLAVNYSQDELKKEASLYEAQFGQVHIGDDFYREVREPAFPKEGKVEASEVTTERHTVQRERTGDTWRTNEVFVSERVLSKEEDKALHSLRLNYYGFKVQRELAEKDGGARAFELVCGIAPSKDGQVWQIAPLSFKTDYAKAKVLSDQPAWWLLPTTWFRWLFGTSGHEIDTEVNVDVQASWMGKDQVGNTAKVGAFDMKFPAYDLDKQLLLHQSYSTNCPSPKEGKLSNRPSGWLLGIPVSYNEYREPVGRGTFAINVLVTERDKSNAKKYLEQGAKLLGDNSSKITGAVQKALNP